MSFLQYQHETPEFINNYLKYRRYVLFDPETTIDETFFDLRTFFRYLILALENDKNKIENITRDEFRNISIKNITLTEANKVTGQIIINFSYFLAYNLNNESKARNRKLATLKKFFEYLNTNNLIPTNPASNIDFARVPKRLAKFLNLYQSKQLLATAVNSEKKYKTRNYAIICLFLNLSIRLSELVNIDIDDIKLDEKSIKVCGKGNKERILYLDDACIEAINEYLKLRETLPITNPDHNALFLSSRKQRISKRNVQIIIKEEMQTAFNDIEDSKKINHVHTLRHSSVSLMYNINDTDIFVLKKILGHTSLSATEIYTHIDPKKLKFIMENFGVSDLIKREKENLNNGK